MARPPRVVRAGAWHHLTARGIEQRPIFHDDPHACGLKLKTPGELAGGIDYVSVSGDVRRLEKRAEKEKFFKKLLHHALAQIENE